MSTLKSSAEDLSLNADGSGNDIKFQINAVEKASIDQDGNVVASGTISSTGDTTITSGDIVFATAGKGIVLGATSNTDANTLDDYEEGTWTPTVTGSTSGSGTITGDSTGHYTKIGKICTISIGINNAAFPTIVGTYRMSIPFTSATDQQFQGGEIYFYPLANWTSGTDFAGLVPTIGASTGALAYHTFQIKLVDDDRQGGLSSTNSSISGASNTYCRYSITYVTA